MALDKNIKSVVITGSSKGLGLAMAKVFLAEGCVVAISSFEKQETEAAAKELAALYGSDKVIAYACDVTKYDEVEGLWNAAMDAFGKVDIWISNAGICSEFLDIGMHFGAGIEFQHLFPLPGICFFFIFFFT